MRPLEAAGGEVAYFLPLTLFNRRPTINFRNHPQNGHGRRLHRLSGGMNIGDEYTADWHDLALQLEGPIVDQFAGNFRRRLVLCHRPRNCPRRTFFASGTSPERAGRFCPPPDDDQAVCSLFGQRPSHRPHNFTHGRRVSFA